MTSSVNFSNHQWLVNSFDSNKNGTMDELKAADHIKQSIDTDKNGSISKQELVSALQQDKVEIRQGTIEQSRGFNIHVEGLETLKSVRATANQGISNTHVFTPTLYSDDTSRDRYHKLKESNRSYDSAINSMESSLRSIRDMTAGKTDATSRALHIQAKTTLNSTQWNTWSARLQQNMSRTRDWFNDYTPGQRPASPSSPSRPVNSGDPYGKDPFSNGGGNQVSDSPYGKDPFNSTPGDNSQPIIPDDPYLDRLDPYLREQEQILTNLKTSYEVMNNALKAIKEQTNDLPDLQASVQATDRNISKAFANLGAIENSGKTPQQVSQNIRKEADATDAKATGRTGPYAGIGAGVGLVAGAAIGYFAGGRTTKSALMGAGIGAAASGGIGALVGNGIDAGYKSEATSLRSLAGRVETYNPESDKQSLSQTNVNLYNKLFDARSANDLDRARVVNNDLKTISGSASTIANRSGEIADAHRKY